MTLQSNPVLHGAVAVSQPWPAPQDRRDRAQARPRQAVEQVSYGRMDSPLGPLWIVVGSRGVRQVVIGGDEAAVAAELPPTVSGLAPDALAVQPAIAQLTEYFHGTRRSFDLAVDLSAMSAFQQAVLREVSRVPAGQVITYSELAARIGKPQAARAVGNALGANPVPIIVPCHRVVRSGGHLGGYTGGLDRKRFLLQLEGAL